jgi:nucleotide-binding universal stress UspA family protein
MGTLKHIVVAVDGSAPSRRATAFALTLAAREAARISFCTVVDPVPAYAHAAGGALIDVGGMLAALKEEAGGFCLEATARAAAHGVDASSSIMEGSAPDALREFADRNGADAIVVGTHGRRGAARVMLGSVASAMVRSARVPVFTVRADATVAALGPIVVAVDVSKPSLAALRTALSLARSEQCALHLVHVFDDYDLDRIGEYPGYDPPIARRRAMAQTSDQLVGIADRVRVENVPFTSQMCEGDPVAETLAVAARVHARFVAVGTHGRNALGRFVYGSVAEGLIRDAPLPVMTVRVQLPVPAPRSSP